MRNIALMVVLAFWAVVPANGATNRTSFVQQLEALRQENDALRRENQMLRRELVANKKRIPDELLPERAVSTNARIVVSAEDTGYWISSSSGTRHNRRCRSYRTVKGRPCGPKDGKPCKRCGG